jgi:hypothetical protein
MEQCEKCGSKENDVKFVSQGALINSSSFVRVDDEFINASEYDYFYKLTAKIDHLLKKCECGYSWRERTLSA